MSSTRRNALTNAARDASHPQPTEPPPETPRPVQAAKLRTTLDLSPVDHAKLRTWCNHAADELGRASVDKAQVWRALLDELTTDDDLSARILNRLR